MKQSIIFAVLAYGWILVSCGTEGRQKEEGDRDPVREFAKDFALKASRNDIKALKDVYPDLEYADSIRVAYEPDNIFIKQGDTSGIFEIELSPDVYITTTAYGDGTFVVTRSRGLFAFPKGSRDIAQLTGMDDGRISDKELASRLKDREFFRFLDANLESEAAKIITVGPYVRIDDNTGYYELTNHSDQLIGAEDYDIIMKYSINFVNWETEDYDIREEMERHHGKTIPPESSIQFEVYNDDNEYEEVVGVEMNFTSEQLNRRFAGYTGNEYREYLDSKRK